MAPRWRRRRLQAALLTVGALLCELGLCEMLLELLLLRLIRAVAKPSASPQLELSRPTVYTFQPKPRHGSTPVIPQSHSSYSLSLSLRLEWYNMLDTSASRHSETLFSTGLKTLRHQKHVTRHFDTSAVIEEKPGHFDPGQFRETQLYV